MVSYRVRFRVNKRVVGSVVVVERWWIVGSCAVCELVP